MLDFDALLAGAWFIAIDFQLFLLMLSITWLSSNAKNSRNIKLSIITLMVTISLFWFNRSAGFDDWAVYFFGAYGLGSVAFLAGNRRQFNNLWFWLNVTLATVAIFVDFRARILIAVLVTLILFFSREAQLKEALIGKKIIHYLGKISYSIFLVHFSILMLANSIFVGFNLSSPYVGLISMFVAWVVSILAADLFYNRVEKYFSMILKRHIKSLSQS
jgi:peptidoglycan/LPS O-acetylase OafA/YrhL